ncbi:LacI family DNA-binding transcriptional regulator, partial [Alistipes communis]
MERTGSVSMQDVAKEAGVSPQTVSRVANGSDAV